MPTNLTLLAISHSIRSDSYINQLREKYIHGSCFQIVWLLSKHVFWLYIHISVFLQYLDILTETTFCPRSTVTKLICLHHSTENLRRGMFIPEHKKVTWN